MRQANTTKHKKKQRRQSTITNNDAPTYMTRHHAPQTHTHAHRHQPHPVHTHKQARRHSSFLSALTHHTNSHYTYHNHYITQHHMTVDYITLHSASRLGEVLQRQKQTDAGNVGILWSRVSKTVCEGTKVVKRLASMRSSSCVRAVTSRNDADCAWFYFSRSPSSSRSPTALRTFSFNHRHLPLNCPTPTLLPEPVIQPQNSVPKTRGRVCRFFFFNEFKRRDL